MARLATLTLDTTGLNSGTFPLRLSVDGELGPFDTTIWNAVGEAVPLSVTEGTLIVAIPIVGDYNRNGAVDAADYTVWRDSLGQTGANLPADGNGDTHVDAVDYGIWKQHFAEVLGGGAAAIAVPEPSTGLLLVMSFAGAGLILRRSRVTSRNGCQHRGCDVRVRGVSFRARGRRSFRACAGRVTVAVAGRWPPRNRPARRWPGR